MPYFGPRLISLRMIWHSSSSFTFKEWKRLLLDDGPRQNINTITSYSYWSANGHRNPSEKLSVHYNGKDYVTAILLVAMVFTVVVFLGSLLLIIIAGILYVPLLCYIRGNLKEYSCHKVDKLAELIKKKTHQRVQPQTKLVRKEGAGDFLHLKNKNGDAVTALPQPTVSVDDDEGCVQHNQYWSDSKSAYGAKSNYAPRTYAGTTAGDQDGYPLMTGYNNG
ncbi:hypothetical protein FRC03_012731 [Tulasnella sp. 419]|nr:hypothetical protein FRC03_012731 [Tulasnella sp. 419]